MATIRRKNVKANKLVVYVCEIFTRVIFLSESRLNVPDGNLFLFSRTAKEERRRRRKKMYHLFLRNASSTERLRRRKKEMLVLDSYASNCNVPLLIL